MEENSSKRKKKDESGSKTTAWKIALWNLCRVSSENSDIAKLH